MKALFFVILLGAGFQSLSAKETKTCTSFVNGKQVGGSECPPVNKDDFIVKSRELRIKRNSKSAETPYQAIHNLCENKKDGKECDLLSAYHEERGDAEEAKKYSTLACQYGYLKSCPKKDSK